MNIHHIVSDRSLLIMPAITVDGLTVTVEAGTIVINGEVLSFTERQIVEISSAPVPQDVLAYVCLDKASGEPVLVVDEIHEDGVDKPHSFSADSPHQMIHLLWSLRVAARAPSIDKSALHVYYVVPEDEQ